MSSIEDKLNAIVGSIYDTAVATREWTNVLPGMAALFNAHFADRFSRTDDFSQYRGIAHGLSDHDYQHLFLDTWVKRNTWSQRKPARLAGEVLSTRQMVPTAELKRQPIFTEFLDARALHEGLRLVVWAGDGWVSDISFLRSWSAGPYTAKERALGGTLLAHVRRAFAIEQRIQVGDRTANAFDAVAQPLFLLDRDAKLRRTNAAGDALLSANDPLRLTSGQLAASFPAEDARLRSAVRQVAEAGPASHHLAVRRRVDGATYNILLIPVREEAGWIALSQPMVLMLACEPPASTDLSARYRLTAAEARLAADLTSGLSLSAIAERSGRSINTVRTHLSRLMSKTNTTRQAELMRCLIIADDAPPLARH